MNLDEAIREFSRLSEAKQALLLAQFAFQLTILARGTYFEEEPIRITARDINEMQHRVTAGVVARLLSRRERYDDEVLVRRFVDSTDNEPALSTGPIFIGLLAKMSADTNAS